MHLESYFVVSYIELFLQYHLIDCTQSNDTYGVNVTLPGIVRLAYKSLQLLNPLLHQKVSAHVNVTVALVCLPLTQEFVRH